MLKTILKLSKKPTQPHLSRTGFVSKFYFQNPKQETQNHPKRPLTSVPSHAINPNIPLGMGATNDCFSSLQCLGSFSYDTLNSTLVILFHLLFEPCLIYQTYWMRISGKNRFFLMNSLIYWFVHTKFHYSSMYHKIVSH